MTVAPTAPTADYAERAFAAARALTGEPAEECPRARLLAMAGLSEVFKAHGAKRQIAGLLGFAKPETAANSLEKARNTTNWWNDAWVDEVTGALMADHFGERAL